jgi:hypothetical protein
MTGCLVGGLLGMSVGEISGRDGRATRAQAAVRPDRVEASPSATAAGHEGNGRPDEALEYWMQAGDADSVARLAIVLAFPAYQRGMVATAER